MTPEDVRKIFCYDPETGFLFWRERKQGRTFGAVGRKDNDGYLFFKMNRHKDRFCVHRVAWAYVHGKWPADQIDHINGNKSDNRLCNLREASTTENMWNVGKQSHNTSGLKAVSWHEARQNWRATMKIAGAHKHLGSSKCPAVAHFIYQIAADKIHGSFARVF